MNYCLNCGKETTNPKFCCQSCAASYNNRQRKKVERFCKICGIKIGEGTNCRKQYCDNCRPGHVDWSIITLGETRDKRTFQINSRVRELARDKTKSINRFQRCAVCGYTKHVEVCHIKAIKDFPDNATIEEVNNLNNLIGLCPNHHWEFDNGLLPFDTEWLNDI